MRTHASTRITYLPNAESQAARRSVAAVYEHSEIRLEMQAIISRGRFTDNHQFVGDPLDPLDATDGFLSHLLLKETVHGTMEDDVAVSSSWAKMMTSDVW